MDARKNLLYWKEFGFEFIDTSDSRIKIGKLTDTHWRVFYRDDSGYWDYTGPAWTRKTDCIRSAAEFAHLNFGHQELETAELIYRRAYWAGESMRETRISPDDALREIHAAIADSSVELTQFDEGYMAAGIEIHHSDGRVKLYLVGI